ncbi:MAG: hypothetical protein GY913_13965 [Proteobacteria bacterium]|nr:hypothetical protein [Pseudomonadota bacterium]MCP4918014.1 hypothetical protein [Pseudomonadota bacterium]
MSLPVLLSLSGCFVLDMIGGDDSEALSAADSKLGSGDVVGAVADYNALYAANPASVDAAVGAAYGDYVAGDLAAADAKLAGTEEGAGERLAEVKMRRALVALASGDTDALRAHATASGTAAGKVLVAEVALADGERDEAMGLLDEASGAGGSVGAAAQGYLALLESDDPAVQGLAENYALWALGERAVAVKSVEEVVKSMPDDDRKSEELLLWAGRAASEGEPLVASSLLESISFPPAGQAWRVHATRAIILCADGETDACIESFDALDAAAPADGLLHARATAAMLVDDAGAVEALLPDHPNAASALAASLSGNDSLARELAPSGLLSEHLGAR